MLETIERLGAAMKSRYRRRQMVRMLDRLPPEVQKDIGWPSTGDSIRNAHLISVIWGAAR